MQERIPVLWKTSCVVPVPKKATPSGLNNFRPVALTSHGMKQHRSSTRNCPVSFPYILYTSDFKYNFQSCHLQNVSNDSAMVGCIRNGQESEYRELVNNFAEWFGRNRPFLLLNVNKTKEMVVDFTRKRTEAEPVNIMGEEVGTVEHYKYLGVHLNSRLDWSTNTDAPYKKERSRLYFLRMCVQEDVGDLLPVCGCERHPLCCGLLGERHQCQRCQQD
ncbi:hypothetical protein L3Q82_021922 [Scortum barcoo]|uniref:Uncharacterized protein n=1 Tax=Scortum barcoo TaxID=214431 RepID=A0ACB8X5X1_9TELE|nr:hypothetical protein L3Q82_021922 [Scortum barcoo]